MLGLELLDEVIDETVVKVLTTRMGITIGGHDAEDTLLDGPKGDIEGDQDIALARDLLVEIVGDWGIGGLVDDTKDVETG